MERRGAPIVGVSTNVLDTGVGDDRIDGIGVYTSELVRGLAREGAQVRRIGMPVLRGLGVERPRNADLILPIPAPFAVAASCIAGVAHLGGGTLASKIDVYHSTDYVIPTLRRIPVVATLYDAIPFARPEWTNPRFRRLKNWVLRESAARADCILAISHSAVPELCEHYRIPVERIRVVPLGLSSEWFEPVPEESIARVLDAYGLQRGYFLFVGSLQPRKNVAALLAAYDRLPRAIRDDRQLVIAGKYGWSVPDLRVELQRRRSAGACMWMDYVPAAELRALYAGAGALVFPSLAEGFGFPVVEALATGTPVIASDLPCLRELGGEQVTFVPPGDTEALCAAMGMVTNGGSDRAGRSERQARARRFPWSATIRGTLDVYRKLIGGDAG
jgi:glycosyltransferase involved in cell wall biosynthesis